MMPRNAVKISSNHRRAIVSRYQKGEGLLALSAALGYGVQIVRRVLVDNGIEIRPQGRPAKS